MSDAVRNPATSGSSTPSPNPPQTGGSAGAQEDQPAEPETQSFTIKSVNTGLLGKHVRETVEVDGKSYGPGDSVELTEVAHKSLVAMGVKFESDDKDKEE